jgi:hypothetical protein
VVISKEYFSYSPSKFLDGLFPDGKLKLVTDQLMNFFSIVLEMRRMVKEMLEEVDGVDRNNSVCEDLYGKLEQKVRKKFNEEVERLEKSFRRIIEQLEIQQ